MASSAKNSKEIKIFSLNRIKFNELYEDALTYIKTTYKAVGLKFTAASPFGQLLLVVLHLGRMIFYYIEDSITGLNIKTAYRPDLIRGLAMLTGHDAARPISSRAAIRISFHDTGNAVLIGQIAFIPNKLLITSKINGYKYTVLLGSPTAKITMVAGNFIDASIILGVIKMQSATATGMELLSFNFSERNYGEFELYYIVVYVNNEPWDIVLSLHDLGYNQKGCIVRTGINGGIDVFFGNGVMGAIPPAGASITIEYVLSDGAGTNLSMTDSNADDNWEIDGQAILTDGTTIDMSLNFKVSLTTDVIFGTASEDVALTLMLAPHASLTYVLANENNYVYFFKKMNMFSRVSILKGVLQTPQYNNARIQRALIQQRFDKMTVQYEKYLTEYGSSYNLTIESYEKLQTYSAQLSVLDKQMSTISSDNTVYIYLIPDIKTRIASYHNYYTCDESLFTLTDTELENIATLIDNSGQKIIGVENRIVLPLIVRFALNVQCKIWNTYNKETVYQNAVNVLSDYFLNNKREDIIPISDIISLFENNVAGVDSVKAWFVADKENINVYGTDYGIDAYGDVKLYREIKNNSGITSKICDILPIFKGGFTSEDGTVFSKILNMNNNSGFNLYISSMTNPDAFNSFNYESVV